MYKPLRRRTDGTVVQEQTHSYYVGLPYCSSGNQSQSLIIF